jgi:hypothetical protein
VKLDPNLNAFNRRFVMAMRDVFSDFSAEQSADGTLCLCGSHPRDGTVCTHVVVHLEGDVLAALNFATPLQGETMTRKLIEKLSTQVRTRYDPSKLGQAPLRFVGTLEMLHG